MVTERIMARLSAIFREVENKGDFNTVKRVVG
jgi:hypothetical protein